VTRLLSTFAVIWRLAHPYFFSSDRRAGRLLLTGVILIELSLVGINILINRWQARFYNSLQDRAWDVFVEELILFGVLALSYVVLAAYQVYLQQWLLIRWRTWMTHRYLDRWLRSANHYRMQLLGDLADNPDQRIAEDTRLFAERAIFIGIRILGAGVSLISFVVVLWMLSAEAPLRLFGYDVPVAGHLVWAAVIYATIGTMLTHLIGRPLIRLNFLQQRYEADFRFSLVGVREHSEQIALLRGEAADEDRLKHRFGFVIANWRQIMSRVKRLTFLTAGYQRSSVLIPYLLASPAYFAGKIQLGMFVQTASAFESVREALSVFIDAYRDLAEWRAVIDRLDGFDAAIAQAEAAAAANAVVRSDAKRAPASIAIDELLVRLPGGRPLVAADGIAIRGNDSVLITGPSGSGKSTLFRTIGGLWPFVSGAVLVPPGARVMMLPQKPYFPVGTLAAAISYPGASGAFSTARIAEAVGAVGLPGLVPRLEEEAHWERVLSPGDQQRLSIARALLHAPDFLFLDEATASLDETAEMMLHELIRRRLDNTAIVSIGQRSALGAFHGRHLTMGEDKDRYRLHEIALARVTG
jgi:putative ATP-binding cassette transporter